MRRITEKEAMEKTAKANRTRLASIRKYMNQIDTKEELSSSDIIAYSLLIIAESSIEQSCELRNIEKAVHSS